MSLTLTEPAKNGHNDSPRNTFFRRSIITVDGFTRSDMETLIERSDQMKDVLSGNEYRPTLRGKIVTALFAERSTRTRGSFFSAVKHLGGHMEYMDENTTSAGKGEILSDTISTLIMSTSPDAIIMRHPFGNSAKLAESVSRRLASQNPDISYVPIINAGSGANEHPTQAFLDMRTIQKELGRLDNAKIAFAGDLKYGRTVHSLAQLLANTTEGNELILVSPEELALPEEVEKKLSGKVKIQRASSLEEIAGQVDVLYMTRVQKERFGDQPEDLQRYERLKHKFVLTGNLANAMRRNAIIMHPLPRVGEIEESVDTNPRARYENQMRHGLLTRMALMEMILTAY